MAHISNLILVLSVGSVSYATVHLAVSRCNYVVTNLYVTNGATHFNLVTDKSPLSKR